MDRSDRARVFSRRSLLRAAGLAAGASLVGGVIPSPGVASAAHAASAAGGGAPFRIGLLLPESQLVPAFGPGLLSGLELALAQAKGQAGGRPLALHVERYGVTPAQALERARQLVAGEGVDVLVGAFSRHQAARLGALLEERRTPLVVADVGANALRANRQRPLVLRSSLGHWRASWALGEWAARHVGKRALVVSSFYDSGYDTVHAFGEGFAAAGGQRPGVHVTHMPGRGRDLAPAIAAIREARPDAVFAVYSGWRAAAFVRAYAEAGIAQRIPLLGSSFLADEALLPELGGAANGVVTASSWAPGLSGASERAFAAAYRPFAARPADAFAALGYDTGRMLLGALDTLGDNASGVDLRDALAQTSFAGARGPVVTHAPTLDAASPVYLRVVEGGALRPTAQLLEARDMPELDVDNLKTGWSNAYLCA